MIFHCFLYVYQRVCMFSTKENVKELDIWKFYEVNGHLSSILCEKRPLFRHPLFGVYYPYKIWLEQQSSLTSFPNDFTIILIKSKYIILQYITYY